LLAYLYWADRETMGRQQGAVSPAESDGTGDEAGDANVAWTTIAENACYLTSDTNSLLYEHDERLKVGVQNEAELVTQRLVT